MSDYHKSYRMNLPYKKKSLHSLSLLLFHWFYLKIYFVEIPKFFDTKINIYTIIVLPKKIYITKLFVHLKVIYSSYTLKIPLLFFFPPYLCARSPRQMPFVIVEHIHYKLDKNSCHGIFFIRNLKNNIFLKK